MEQEHIDGTAPARHSRLFTVDPSQHGLWDRVVSGGRILHEAWLRAVAEGAFVGTSRRCGAYLRPDAADDRGGGRFDYVARCTNESVSGATDGRYSVAGCGAEMCAPGGRLPGTADRERKAEAAAKRANKRQPKVPPTC